jgi:signal transduction histidine kinase
LAGCVQEERLLSMQIRTTSKENFKTFLTALGLLLVITIGIFDYLAGPLYSSLIAYLIPVIFVTRFVGRKAGIVLSVGSSLTWIIAEILSDPGYHFLFVHFWNLLEVLGIFLIVVFILLKLSKIEDERNRLFSMLVHDMKNPALVAKGFSERLLKEKAGPLTARQREYLELINFELFQLERMIMDSLDTSIFESGRFKLNLTSFDILSELRNHIKTCRGEAEKKDISILMEFPEVSMLWINADAALIGRVVSNLMRNAIKYSKMGGEITAKIAVRNKDVLIQVKDSGVGISEEHIRHIFNPFYRINNDHSGSGLGLTVVSSIIKAHRGKIWVESMPGKGSTFSFTLPRSNAEYDH